MVKLTLDNYFPISQVMLWEHTISDTEEVAHTAAFSTRKTQRCMANICTMI